AGTGSQAEPEPDALSGQTGEVELRGRVAEAVPDEGIAPAQRIAIGGDEGASVRRPACDQTPRVQPGRPAVGAVLDDAAVAVLAAGVVEPVGVIELEPRADRDRDAARHGDRGIARGGLVVAEEVVRAA